MNTATAKAMSEREYQDLITEYAELKGFLKYHTWNSRRSDPGFPDLVLVRPPRLIFAEVKRESGKVTVHQRRWLDTLGEIPHLETYLWYPSDWPQVRAVLD